MKKPFQTVLSIRYRVYCILYTVFCILYTIYFIPVAYGQGSSFKVSPLIVEHIINSKDFSFPFKITNTSETDLTIQLSLKQMEGQKKDGTILYKNEPDNEYKRLFNAITFSSENQTVSMISIEPKQTKEIIIEGTVNNNQDYYFSLFFITKADKVSLENSSSSVATGIATHLLLSNGSSFKSGLYPKINIGYLHTQNKIPIEVDLSNKGSKITKTSGSIVISNLFGKEVGTIKFIPRSILPNSTLKAESLNQSPNSTLIWDSQALIGPYKATINIHEANSKTTTQIQTQTYFFLLPLKLLIILIASLLFFLLIIFRVIKKLRTN